MSKKHAFLRFFAKIALFACVFCAFFISPVFANLPAGYTELEYIESTGTQYIDTGYNLDTNNLTIKTRIREIGSKTGESDICGNQDSTTNRFVVGYYGNGSFAYNRAGSGSAQTNATFELSRTNDNEVEFVFDGNNQKKYIIVNGTKGSEAVFSKNIYPSNSVIKIFQDGKNDNYIKCQMKYLQLIGDGALVRNFIPARRNSDDEIGVYDTVSGTFFTNQGTGDFIAGPVANCKTFGTDGVTCTECETDYILNNDGGCSEKIKIATTKYVDDEFAPLDTALANAISTVDSVVTQTIAQATAIGELQNTKQTRPSDDNECPAGKKCLLVTDETGTPHWYEIIEP